jgi:hypothetical protein
LLDPRKGLRQRVVIKCFQIGYVFIRHAYSSG